MIKIAFKPMSFIFFLLIVTMNVVICTASAADKKIIGVIIIPNILYFENIHGAFTETLNSGGIEADEIELITLNPLPEPISLMNTVRKFAAIDTDIIVAYGAPAALAAVSEQSDIPVVFAGVFDPDAVGISLKNATGISSTVPVSTIVRELKRLSIISKLGVLYSETEKDSVLQTEQIRRLEEKLGFDMVSFNIKKVQDTKRITGVDALLLTTSCPASYCILNIIDIARKEGIPTASLMGGQEEDGILLTIAANPQEQGRETARLVLKLLKGEAAASLPVKRPVKVDMIINLKEATSLGIKVPFDLLSSATKIIK